MSSVVCAFCFEEFDSEPDEGICPVCYEERFVNSNDFYGAED